jgi:hypothetical protein
MIITPNEDQVFTTLRAFIVTLAGTQRVLRTPVNRADMPKDAFVAMTPGVFELLATNSSTTNATTRTVYSHKRFDCQIDCYGPSSSDLANTITTLFRDPYGADALAVSGFDIAPLYADTAQQMPIVDSENQYQERWTFKLVLQVNHVVSTDQQSANIATVDIVNVDSTYPPT